MPRIDVLWYEIEARTEKFARGMDDAEKRVEKFGKLVRAHPVAALGALAATMGLVAAEATKMAAGLETALRQATRVVPEASSQFQQLREQIVELSTEVPISAQELAKGLETVFQRGVRDPAQAMSVLRTAAQGAEATGEELTTVITQLDVVMDAFGIKTAHAAEVMDLLVRAGQGGAPMAQVADVIEKVGAYAAAAGVKLEDLVTLVTTLLAQGVPQMGVLRGLRSTFGGVATDAEDADKQANKLALSLKVVNGELEVGGRYAQAYAAEHVFLADAMGASARAAEEMSKTAEEQYKLLKNNLNAALLDLGNSILPLVINRFEAWASWIQRVREMLSAHPSEDAVVSAIERLATAQVNAERRLEEVRGRQRGQGLLAGTESLIAGAAHNELAAVEMEVRDWATRIANFKARYEAAVDRIRRQPPGGSGTATGAPGGPPPVVISEADQKRAEQFLDDIRSRYAALNDTVSATLLRQLEQLAERFSEVRRALTPEQIREVQRALTGLRSDVENAREAAAMGEDLEAQGRILDELVAKGFVMSDVWAQMRGELQASADILKEAAGRQGISRAEQDRYNALLRQALALLDRMTDAEEKKHAATQKSLDDRKDEVDTLREQAQVIERSARAAIELAQAFGLVDENAARALTAISEIGANIPAALKGDWSSILNVAGGAASLLGSLFGESPEDRRYREVLEENSKAILDLTRVLGENQLAITGNAYALAARVIAGAPGPWNPLEHRGIQQTSPAGWEAYLRSMGTSAAEFNEIMKSLGITFAGTIPTFRELEQAAQALKATELDQFANTFAGQMELLRRQLDAFDISDPIQALEALKKAILAIPGGGTLQAALRGFDLTTAAGRAAAEQYLEQLFTEATSGTLQDWQIPLLFGNLTPTEFLDAIQQLLAGIRSANSSAGAGTTTQWGINRTITEATASRQLALMTTMVYWLEQIASATAALARGVVPPTSAELALWRGAAPLGGAAVQIGRIEVSVSLGSGSESEAQAAGAAVGQAVLQEINRAFAVAAAARARAQGDVALN